MPPRGVWLLGVGMLGTELLSRLPLGFRAPGLILHPLLLFVAYRFGLRASLWGGLLVAAYVTYSILYFEVAPGALDNRPWRVGLLALSVAAAAALGYLRDHVARLEARERHARETAEGESRRTHGILEGMADGFLMLDREGRITYVNRAARLLLRRSPADLLDRNVGDVLPPAVYHHLFRKHPEAPEPSASIRFETHVADESWIEVHAVPSVDGIAVSFRDVTERRKHEEKLRGMTLIDELTGLYNRRGFFALAEQQWKLSERTGRNFLLVFADLDDLKRINDTFGHTVGDQALFEAAAVLRHTFRGTDVVARIGGDEFAALVLESEPDTAPGVLQRLDDNIRQANAEATLPFALSMSFGLAHLDASDPKPIGELLSLADARMYENKRSKRR